MSEHPSAPTSIDPATTVREAPPPRRRLVLPAVVAALALGAVGTGAGYAAVSQQQ
jgi:hypothetical protein